MLRASMQRRFYFLRKRFRLRDSKRVHACPIHAGQQRGVHPHDAGHNGRPFEAAAIEPLPIQHKAAAVPDDNLHPVGALCTEDHRYPFHRVMAQRLLRQERQAIRAPFRSPQAGSQRKS
jgi:hypothetical protein